MITFLFSFIISELNEKGFLYSVGKKKFLSLDNKNIRIVPRYIMPSMFEIETRTDNISYYLRIYPSPRQNDKVVDKDWFWNDHRLIIHRKNDWMSQHFLFSLIPKNMIKIVVKEKCVEVDKSGYVKAKTCKSKKKALNQYFRWFNEEDRYIVEDYVERHGGNPYKRYDDSEYDSDEYTIPKKYKKDKEDDDSEIDNELYRRRYGKGNRGRTKIPSFLYNRKKKRNKKGKKDKNDSDSSSDDDFNFDWFNKGGKNKHKGRYNKYDEDCDDKYGQRNSNRFRDKRDPYNRRNYGSNRRGKNPLFDNDSEDICDVFDCESINKKESRNNRRNSDFKQNKDYRSSGKGKDDICDVFNCESIQKRLYPDNNRETSNKDSKGSKKNKGMSLECDNMVDDIEKLICDIQKTPDFIV